MMDKHLKADEALEAIRSWVVQQVDIAKRKETTFRHVAISFRDVDTPPQMLDNKQWRWICSTNVRATDAEDAFREFAKLVYGCMWTLQTEKRATSTTFRLEAYGSEKVCLSGWIFTHDVASNAADTCLAELTAWVTEHTTADGGTRSGEIKTLAVTSDGTESLVSLIDLAEGARDVSAIVEEITHKAIACVLPYKTRMVFRVDALPKEARFHFAVTPDGTLETSLRDVEGIAVVARELARHREAVVALFDVGLQAGASAIIDYVISGAKGRAQASLLKLEGAAPSVRKDEVRERLVPWLSRQVRNGVHAALFAIPISPNLSFSAAAKLVAELDRESSIEGIVARTKTRGMIFAIDPDIRGTDQVSALAADVLTYVRKQQGERHHPIHFYLAVRTERDEPHPGFVIDGE